jgi:hypothetical protein
MNKYNNNMITSACELMSVLMHHGPRDKCGSVGSGSHQLTDKEYIGELWNVVIAFSAGFFMSKRIE